MSVRAHRGALVPAHHVASVLGLDVRTVRRWVASKRLRGTFIAPGVDGRRGRWYVYRDAFDALRGAST